MHGSLLPRYRGRAPINWVLIKGESETGVTLHHMDEKPDHGDVVAQRAISISRDDTALTVTRKVAAAAGDLLRIVLPQLEDGTAPRIPQDHRAATYFGARRPEDGRIDWRRTSEEIRNLVRAVTDPWPGAFSSHRGRRLWVWAAETRGARSSIAPGELFLDADGAPLVGTSAGEIELVDVTWEGAGRSSGRAWARDAGIHAGERLDTFARAGDQRGGPAR
jgi:methionyl-tRNA formyltransferase